MKKLLICITLIMLILLGCDEQEDTKNTSLELSSEQIQMPKDGDKIAIIKTSLGEVRLRLFKAIAPEAVDQFIMNVESGYYDGLELFSPPNKVQAHLSMPMIYMLKNLLIFSRLLYLTAMRITITIRVL